MSRNDIGDNGIQHLAEASYMSNLRQLLLDDSKIGPQGAQYLSISKYITQLRCLSLKNNKLGN